MGILSDKKLSKLKSMSSQGGFWYITKQNLIFRDLCYIAKILEKWGDRENENYQTFFDRYKVLPDYGGFPQLTAHRATKNCEYLGLIRRSDKYSSKNLTPFYFSLKGLCNGDFNKLSLYPEIIDKQLEKIFIDSQNNIQYTQTFKICPFMFIFKILLLIGDITKSYKISISEFKLFVATAQNWNEYFEVVESILRYRNDLQFKQECDTNSPKVADVRYNILAQNHSQLEVSKIDIAIKEKQVNNIRRKVAEYELNETIQSADDIFKATSSSLKDKPLQQIFYGAPGTGKSHEIKVKTKGESIIRTTFHPDSDYSTFVGAYKPTMDDVETKVIPVVLGESGTVFNKNDGTYKEKRIVYQFVMQAFLKAYLGAWKKYADREGDEAAPQFLVIEEINRGNCAQIFGDLFQLLDRGGNRFSEYAIEADSDLQQEIEKAFKDEKDYKLKNDIDVEGIVVGYTSNYESTLSEDIQHGRVLLLPPNLYIWATMNTSDQSLFPIDSAFKRRWDWEYVPIGYKNTNWTIEIGDKKYNWVDFQRKINDKIYDVDNSEDKQLGDYFVNADRTDNKISAKTLLNKILFYLWNDVCKDDPDHIFKWVDDDKKEKSIKFSEFFCDEDERDRKLQGFMAFNKVPEIGESKDANSPETPQVSDKLETNDSPAVDDN